MKPAKLQVNCNRAVVVQTEGAWARVEVQRSSMCDGCEEKGTCGAHFADDTKTIARVRNPVSARPGDTVEISMAEGVILWGAVTIYLLPVAAMLAAILAAQAFKDEIGLPLGNNALPVVAGVVGLALSLPVVRLVSTRWKYLAEGTPTISRILSPDGVK
ncbi:MAG: SoxR reducing system RseC family protein [Candidatus Glassbacteria bacterium]